MSEHSEQMCCPLPGWLLTTNWNYAVYTKWKQMQWAKSLTSQCRQGKLVLVTAVIPNETSEGFPDSSSDPHPDFNCTRYGCSLFSCLLMWRLLQHPQARLPTGMTDRNTKSRSSAEHSHPTHKAISSLGPGSSDGLWDQVLLLQWMMVYNTSTVSQYLIL